MLDALKDRDAEIARHHADFERWETMADDAVKRAATAVRRAETAEQGQAKWRAMVVELIEKIQRELT